ncbi:MAG: hypothetical protein Q8R44_19640 [Novosphingobium sp.]|nr:hypothetical protein [Novosphingobium sp.]
MRNSIGVWAVVLLCACGERGSQQSPSAEKPVATIAPRPSRSQAAARASEIPAGLALPARFIALGTEPFWAAKVDGERLTYLTPEDQAGQTISLTRVSRGDLVELQGMLAGEQLTLTVSAGPCSDGMSDTVYPFEVRRRLGNDEQRGCAKPN